MSSNRLTNRHAVDLRLPVRDGCERCCFLLVQGRLLIGKVMHQDVMSCRNHSGVLGGSVRRIHGDRKRLEATINRIHCIKHGDVDVSEVDERHDWAFLGGEDSGQGICIPIGDRVLSLCSGREQQADETRDNCSAYIECFHGRVSVVLLK